MRGRMKKWMPLCILIIVIALIAMVWVGERCQARAAKCRADYAAQESRAFGFSVNGNAADQDAINAACEPDSYLCRLFPAANLPTWLLVLVGAVTAFVVGWQSWESRKEIQLQVVAMQQWVETSDWRVGPIAYTTPNAVEADLPIMFSIRNKTKYKMTLHMIVLWINDRHKASIGFQSQLLEPERGYATVSTDYRLTTSQIHAYREGMLSFVIGGMIWYADAFGKDQDQFFGFRCGCRESNVGIFEPIAFIPPHDAAVKIKHKKE